MHAPQTNERFSRSGHLISMQVAGDMTGPYRRKEPLSTASLFKFVEHLAKQECSHDNPLIGIKPFQLGVNLCTVRKYPFRKYACITFVELKPFFLSFQYSTNRIDQTLIISNAVDPHPKLVAGDFHVPSIPPEISFEDDLWAVIQF